MLNTDESFSSDGQKEVTSTQTCYPHLKACGKENTISYEATRRQRVNLVEEYCEESAGPSLHGQSSSAREGQLGHILLDSDEKHTISCICEKARGNVQQCSSTREKAFSCPVHETTPSHKCNIKTHQRTRADEGCFVEDRERDVKQHTSLQTESELRETKRTALCQNVCRNMCNTMQMIIENLLFVIILIFSSSISDGVIALNF